MQKNSSFNSRKRIGKETNETTYKAKSFASPQLIGCKKIRGLRKIKENPFGIQENCGMNGSKSKIFILLDAS